MNKITVKTKNKINNYQPGDLFISQHYKDIYILVENNGKYFCVCLNDGQSWNGFYYKEDISSAITNLDFLGRDMNINIE